MERMTKGELVAEIERRKNAIKKRKAMEVAASSEKRLKLMKELEDLGEELNESNEQNMPSSTSSSATSPSAASSSAPSSSPAASLPNPASALIPKPKNSMLA